MGPVSAIGQGRTVGAGRGATIVAAACSAALHGALAAGVFLWPTGPVPHAVGDPIFVELVVATPESASGATTAAASPDAGPAADIEVALSVQSGSDDAPSPNAATVPPVPRPARRPATPPADTIDPLPAGIETPPASDPTADGPAIAAPAGDPASPGAPAGGDTPSNDDVAAAALVGPRFAVGSAGNPLPRYPLAARRRGLEGRVVLRVFVAADGRARSVNVKTASPHPILDEAAVETLRRWRFEPAYRAGVPVSAWIDVPITFQLRD
jgi:protein TonB